MIKVCILTATRAEYGLLYPLIKRIMNDEHLELQLVVSGTHLSKRYGYTKDEILSDNVPIYKEINILDDNSIDITDIMAKAMVKFNRYIKEDRPDIAVILGDRYEMMAFATVLFNNRIPIAHINGGEITQGALDDIYRDCITRMSTLHFPNCEFHKNRIINMGVNKGLVFNVGDICVENIVNEEFMEIDELEDSLHIELKGKKIAIVTFHPVTMEDNSLKQLKIVMDALKQKKELYYVVTMANADKDGELMNEYLKEFVEHNDNFSLYSSLGRIRYLSLLKKSKMMIGNSSSGLTEAPLFKIPSINIGNRQKNRIHGKTVIDAEVDEKSIIGAVDMALSEEFIDMCKKDEYMFGDGNTSIKIINIIKDMLGGL